MEIKAEQAIDAPREQVYAALNDPDVLLQCIPGCETLTKRSETEMDATVALKIGPVKAKFAGSVSLQDLNPPESYTLVGEGKAGPAGFAKGRAAVTLSEHNGGTLLAYDVDVAMGGKIAQLGSRLVEGTTRKLSAEFFEKFGAIVETGTEAAPPQAPAQKPAPAKSPALKIAIVFAAAILVGILILSQI